MKKLYTFRHAFRMLFLALVFVLARGSAEAQCANDNSFYLDLTTSYDGAQASAFCIYGGEYVTSQVCQGVTYVISTCNSDWDTEITIYDGLGNVLDYDDDGCGITFGPSTITWVSTITGTIYVLVDEYPCLSNSTCAEINITQFGDCGDACTNANVLYNVNATPTGAGNTVTVNNMYGGEYLNISVCDGAFYTMSACAASYDTQLSLYTPTSNLLAYDDDGCGTFAGPSEINWISDMDGTVRLLLDEYPCISNSTNTTITITQNTACNSTCSIDNVFGFYEACVGEQELANFYVYYSGSCSVEGMYVYSNVNGWEYVDLSGFGYTSGDQIDIYFYADNTNFTYYFVLSDGTESLDYFYTTTFCTSLGCDFSSVDYFGGACDGSNEQLLISPTYTGGCTVAGIWIYTAAFGWEYDDLSAFGYTSGDVIDLYLTLDNTDYLFYVVLDDNTESGTYSYQTGTCDIAVCDISTVLSDPLGCVGTDEEVNFYVYYTGSCDVYSMWVFTDAFGWSELVLNGTPGSGDPITIDFIDDFTDYTYYFELSDGTTSANYVFTTGNCDDQSVCSNLLIDYTNTGCVDINGSLTPSGDISVFYNGPCGIEGIYTSVDGAAFEYLDLSAYGLSSGDDIGLYFNIQNADYEVFYLLSDGSTSPSVFFTNEQCDSGETICDCAGTQLPIESLAWLGDGSLDDGTYYWNQDINLPVDFSCATWGFDCGDELPVGFYTYDVYGVCSGEIPPSNGCVDNFCYTVDIDVQTDCHPEDITIYVYSDEGYQVFTASNTDFITEADNLYTFQLCLTAGCYSYSIFDAFGDGLAGGDCLNVGYSGVYDYSVASYVVFVNGDNYLTSYTDEFCVGPQSICDNLDMVITQGSCHPNALGTFLLPTIDFVFDFSGPCTVQSMFLSENGGEFFEVDVSAQGWGSGDEGTLFNMLPNTDYVIYYTTDDGAASYLFNFAVGDCNNEITICDCEGTQLSIGVLDWLGDGFADNGFYSWLGETVNFNCSTWGYDCGDIEGSPSFDPYNVCDGQLPPFNGCEIINEVLGCTDPSAINYNPQATINDGSCIYDLQIGCTDEGACNYNDLAIIDDGSCDYISCTGCTDPDASNYDPTATIDDDSCIYIEIDGCTDPSALNYDPIATNDDGSCIYTCQWPIVVYDSHCVQSDLGNFYIDIDLLALGNGAPYTITNSYNNQQQVMNLLGSVTMGPFPNGTQVVVQVTSNTLECLLTSQPLSETCSGGGIYGCTDPEASNYNASATIDDGSCVYDFILGCTDPLALNYNPEATIDDGSCVYPYVDEVEVAFFSMYPNPTRDQVTLTNNGSSPVVDIRIMDNTGRLVQFEQLVINSGSSHTLDVAKLAQGNYIVKIMGNGNVEHHSLIIQK